MSRDLAWPNVVRSMSSLRGLLALLPSSADWVALLLGLHERHVEECLSASAASTGSAEGGVAEILTERRALPDGGTVLGFEPLGFELGCLPHSWLCNGLETACARALGVRPNSAGFLRSEDEAERATAHIVHGGVGAEPALWLPWMIVAYSGALTPALV